MSSYVIFRMFHGKRDQTETIVFPGNSIQLLDLKREVLERKKMSGSLDFDLKITDETGKDFKDDNEHIPKNSSLVVKRVPVTNASKSLVSKLRGVQSNVPAEIVMSTKPEPAPETVTMANPLTVESDLEGQNQVEATREEAASSEDLSEIEIQKLLEIQTEVPSSSGPSGSHAVGASHGSMRGRPGMCPRCGKPGHSLIKCPTNGDPNFDKPRAQAKTLSAVASGRYKNTDTSVLDKGTISFATEKVDAAEIPAHLRCPLSNSLLREAVELPCCKKVVNEAAIHQKLVTSNFVCPFCNKQGISPGSLSTMSDIRHEVEDFIRAKSAAKADPITATSNASLQYIPSNLSAPIIVPGMQLPLTNSTAPKPPPPTTAPPPKPLSASPIRSSMPTTNLLPPVPLTLPPNEFYTHQAPPGPPGAPPNNMYLPTAPVSYVPLPTSSAAMPISNVGNAGPQVPIPAGQVSAPTPNSVVPLPGPAAPGIEFQSSNPQSQQFMGTPIGLHGYPGSGMMTVSGGPGMYAGMGPPGYFPPSNHMVPGVIFPHHMISPHMIDPGWGRPFGFEPHIGSRMDFPVQGPPDDFFPPPLTVEDFLRIKEAQIEMEERFNGGSRSNSNSVTLKRGDDELRPNFRNTRSRRSVSPSKSRPRSVDRDNRRDSDSRGPVKDSHRDDDRLKDSRRDVDRPKDFRRAEVRSKDSFREDDRDTVPKGSFRDVDNRKIQRHYIHDIPSHREGKSLRSSDDRYDREDDWSPRDSRHSSDDDRTQRDQTREKNKEKEREKDREKDRDRKDKKREKDKLKDKRDVDIHDIEKRRRSEMEKGRLRDLEKDRQREVERDRERRDRIAQEDFEREKVLREDRERSAAAREEKSFRDRDRERADKDRAYKDRDRQRDRDRPREHDRNADRSWDAKEDRRPPATLSDNRDDFEDVYNSRPRIENDKVRYEDAGVVAKKDSNDNKISNKRDKQLGSTINMQALSIDSREIQGDDRDRDRDRDRKKRTRDDDTDRSLSDKKGKKDASRDVSVSQREVRLIEPSPSISKASKKSSGTSGRVVSSQETSSRKESRRR